MIEDRFVSSWTMEHLSYEKYRQKNNFSRFQPSIFEISSDVKYFLSSNGQITGPYQRDELLDALKYGVIGSDAEIRPEESENWLPVAMLKAGATPTQNAVEEPRPFSEMLETRADPAGVYAQYYEAKSPQTAVLLEVLPGIFIQTFGIGNIYAGNVTLGIILMITYWALCLVNFLLLFILIGFVTWPLTFCAYLAFAVINARNGANRSNWERIMSGNRIGQPD